MPSLVEMYSDPEDIAAYTAQTRLYRDYLPRPPVPLREHGPEQDDRWCLKHFQDCGWFQLLIFRRRCRECEIEECHAWLEDIRCKFQRALEAAARGEKVQW